MLKTVDVSELTESQRASLLSQYLKDLAKTYQLRSERAATDPGDPIVGLASILQDKEQEVLRLENWSSIIIASHLGRQMSQQMNQAQMPVKESKPKAEIDGFDITVLIDHVDGALAQSKKMLGALLRKGSDAGEKTSRANIRSLEAVHFLLMQVLEGVRR